MWEIFRRASRVILVTVLALTNSGIIAFAETSILNQNISGFSLPGVSLPSGSDEVRAADGTTCRSAVGGNGAYIDIGLIGNPQTSDQNGNVSAYGRLVVPLGKKPKRVDCTKLYDLEIQRLEMELKLAQMGLAQGISPVFEKDIKGESGDAAADADWINEGWSDEGRKNQ